MSTKKLTLTSSGLKNLVSGVGQDEEFEFIFGKKRISMKNVFAEFISPKVSKLHQTDPTINCIRFNDQFEDITLTNNSISKFNLLSKGESIKINEEESIQLKIISILITNDELFNKLNDLYPREINETNIDLYLPNLTFFYQISQSFNYFNYNNIIDTISSNFYSIDKRKLKKVPKPFLYSIINNSNLRVESEDSLLDFLNEVSDKDDYSEDICLYEEIEFSMLSEDKFEEFIDNFDDSKMTHRLWSKLRQCFYTNKNTTNNIVNQNRYRTKNVKKERKLNDTSDFAIEIIDYLTKEVGGNVHDNRIVNVTSSSKYLNYCAKNAVDINKNNLVFSSANEQNSWLKYDFLRLKVHPIAYTITTKAYDSHHPRNWVIEGSNNNTKWIVLDTRQDDTSLSGASVSRTFDIEYQNGSFRYLRIRQTGHNSSECDFLTFSALEFIGTLSDDKQ